LLGDCYRDQRDGYDLGYMKMVFIAIVDGIPVASAAVFKNSAD